jgi:hypothetical protein
MCVPLVASDDSPEVLEPSDSALHLPPAAIASELSPVLRGRLAPVLAVRTNQVDATTTKPVPQRVAVRRGIIDEPARLFSRDTPFQELFDQRDFMGTGAGDHRPQRQTTPVGEDHGLGPLASFGLAYALAPFFAEENVPSAIDSCQLILPCRSSFASSRDQAFFHVPASVHSWNRRQHVEGEGNCLGRSRQRAPVRRIQRIPSAHGRAGAGGRPPLGERGFSGNKSAISNHCSSVSCGPALVLASARALTRLFRNRFAISVTSSGY